MRPTSLVCLALLAGLAGCATEHPRSAHRHAPGFLVPTAVIVGDGNRAVAAQGGSILPGSDGDYDIPRGEKVAYGGTSFGDTSFYTTYTFDAQAIAIPHTGGTGYRYRWIVQQGAASP
jgi:hypothetical protein